MKTASKILLMALSFLAVTPAFAAEDWKGDRDPAIVHVGGLLGLGVIDSDAGFAVLGTASTKIAAQGFTPDINNSVSIELQAGPLFVSGTSAFAYSTHLRWDFQKDVDWTLYALGGVAGHITGESLGSRFLLFPRFGLGVLRSTGFGVLIRAEVSHEFITMGVALPLYQR